ncbi:ICAT domain-containing protein [Chloropicon roscoffensis]|uniref:ICAT domain-containing protein n=1 Tax=Chloropicon roscoffensis TaxID=1461544 RepID=A0AAX4P2Q5_9CHLO
MASADEKLLANVQDQMSRLLSQLKDLDELRDELDDEEYEETKADTLEQLKEFEKSLQTMASGKNTVVSDLGRMKLAIQAAISEAFKAPEVMKLFALNQPKQLRELMDQIKRDKVLGKHSLEKSDGEILECIMALKKLGEELTPEEAKFLQDNQTRAMSLFEEVDDDQEAKVD